MFEIDVIGSFAAAHALRGYLGRCESLHGHNYKVRLTLIGDRLNDIGLLCDFRDVKTLLNNVIDDLDHRNLNELEPFRNLNPSTENLACYLYREIDSAVSKATEERARVKRVTVWETDVNAVTYFEQCL